MPNPTMSDVHVSQPLTDVSVAFSQQENFVTRSIFPVIPVRKQADKYFKYNLEDILRSDAGPRAPGAESPGSGQRLTTDAYFCDRIALHHDIADPERANADPALNLDADGAEYVTEQISLRFEKDFVDNFFTTAKWDGASSSTDMTGQAAPATTASNFRFWSDVASTPIEDIRGEIISMVQNTGKRPNGLAIGPRVYQALADHPDILDRIKYTERGVITPELLAAIFDVARVDILWATQDGGPEGNAATTKAFLAGKHALLYYAERSPGLKKPTAGYTFVWTGMPGAGTNGMRMKTFRLERNESDRVEGEGWAAYKQVASKLGAFFANAVA